jgi:hypothetical protein
MVRTQAPKLDTRAARKAFEAYWQERHPESKYPRDFWLTRDSVWGDPGYKQPMVHFDWLAFLRGAKWLLQAQAAQKSARGRKAAALGKARKR